jgi:hypothetical protein
VSIGTQGFCETCPYWVAPNAAARGTCRRHPPVAGMGFSAAWPSTTERDWCGEHPARLQAAAPPPSPRIKSGGPPPPVGEDERATVRRKRAA